MIDIISMQSFTKSLENSLAMKCSTVTRFNPVSNVSDKDGGA